MKTEKIRANRLKFAEDHLHWTVDDWKRVCFSDETWIQIRENGRLQFVRRRPGEAFLPECVVSTTKHPVKVMVFGAITPKEKSPLVFVEGSVNADQYRKILKKAKITEFLKVGMRQSFAFMEDGAPAHQAVSMRK